MKKRVLALALAGCLLFGAVGCQGEQEEIYSQAMGESSASQEEAQESGEELSGELTILSVYDFALDLNTEQFEKLHPGVKINVEVGVESVGDYGKAEPWDQFMEELATRLMSGDGPDILLDPGVFTPKQYHQSGVAYNLLEWMDSDPEFHREDYFENVLEGYEVEGAQYALPTSIGLTPLYLNKTLCDAAGVSYSPWDIVDYKELLDIWREADSQGLLDPAFTLEYEDQRGPFELFYSQEMPTFIDGKAGTCSFDSPEFIQYLEDTKSIPSNRTMADGALVLGGPDLVEAFGNANQGKNTSLLLLVPATLESLATVMDVPENVVGPLVLGSSGGGVFCSSSCLVVPTSCADPDLAWEYLKFCVAPVEEASYYSIYQPEGSVDIAYGSFPLAKQNLAAYGEVYAKAAVYQKTKGKIDGFDPTTMDSAVPEGLLSQLEQVFSSYTLGDTLGRVGDILLPVMQQYYDTDTLSAQECAEELQGKVEIWLSE